MAAADVRGMDFIVGKTWRNGEPQGGMTLSNKCKTFRSRLLEMLEPQDQASQKVLCRGYLFR